MTLLLKFLKITEIKKKKEAKKKSQNRRENITKKMKTFLNKLKRGNLKFVIN